VTNLSDRFELSDETQDAVFHSAVVVLLKTQMKTLIKKVFLSKENAGWKSKSNPTF
jgi:hypothetical protein